VTPIALVVGAGLAVSHELAEVVRFRLAEPAPAREAHGHLRAEIALALHDEMQVVRRAQAGAPRKGAVREATALRLLFSVKVAQERAVVRVGENVDAARSVHVIVVARRRAPSQARHDEIVYWQYTLGYLRYMLGAFTAGIRYS